MSIIIETFKCITLKIKSQKFVFREKFANPRKFWPSKHSGYMVVEKQQDNSYSSSFLNRFCIVMCTS